MRTECRQKEELHSGGIKPPLTFYNLNKMKPKGWNRYKMFCRVWLGWMLVSWRAVVSNHL